MTVSDHPWLQAQQETLDKIGRLDELDRQAADEIKALWPITINALAGGINPKRSIKVGKTIVVALEVAHKQLDEDLDKALREADRG